MNTEIVTIQQLRILFLMDVKRRWSTENVVTLNSTYACHDSNYVRKPTHLGCGW